MQNRLWQKILEEEEGQSMVFGAISMFMLACFIALVFNIGDGTSRKIKMQNAADSAAYSGAQIEANSLNTIAWINDGMAFIYYNIMRYAVDYATFATLKKFADHSPIPASAKVIGVSNVRGKHSQAQRIAQEWIRRGQHWLKNLSEIERAIAAATPELIKKEVIEIALANGAKAVALVPDPKYYRSPHPDFRYVRSYFGQMRFQSKEHKRFAEGRVGEFAQKYGKFPDWWSKIYASVDYQRYQYGYYQIRTCWHPQDNLHQPGWPKDKPQPYWTHNFGGANMRLPSGHWHMSHMHLIPGPYGPMPAPGTPHLDGHMDSGSHLQGFIDPAPPSPQHHYMMWCPNCRNCDWDALVSRPRPGEIGRTDWAYFNFQAGNQDLMKVDLRSFSFPLYLKKDFATNGLTVMTWMPKSDKTLIQAVFKNPRVGFFGLARAKVGLWEGGKINTEIKSSFFNKQQNLFEPVEFGAKLVPLAGKSKSELTKLLSSLQNARFYTSYSSKQTTTKPNSYLQMLGPTRDKKLKQLKDVIFH